ncbi:Transposon Ty3-G Gag-Pol poly [Paramuricea clavata]|uniref:Transposon Ty3-G Gag-Pol poly n=1 Tax=Paramuricea clavata TaxID=317549 RepID=A0A6S7G0H2_PARCT|nr:Transposon Ty3-G Gag-Pol poly [Paramuricea clavata]
MVNQFSKFTTNLADLTKPIRELLVKNTAWTWEPPQQDAFDKIKKALTSAPILTLYDPNKATKIAADASSYGLGAVVLQEEEPDTWKPVSFISRSMTTTEARYAQIEKEALAVTWACERSSNYIIGKPITIETDHKLLVHLLTNHTIDKLPPRLQRYKMRLMRFHIKDVRHVPWKTTLHSRHSVQEDT